MATKAAFYQQNAFMWEWLVSTPQKFLEHYIVALVKTRAFKTAWIGIWSNSSESSFYMEFLASNIINTVYFVIPFEYDLNPAVSIITFWKVSGGHGHPFSFITHGHLLVGVDCWVISPTFFPVLTDCCSESVWGTNLGLQQSQSCF
jgi:hypothetical protein